MLASLPNVVFEDVNIHTDLGCRLYNRAASTGYLEADGTFNTTILNAYCEKFATYKRKGNIIVPREWVAVTGAVGAADGTAVICWPSGLNIISETGHWNGTENGGINGTTAYLGGGFFRTGTSVLPMFRLNGYGNTVQCNFVGSAWGGGAGPANASPIAFAPCALEIYRSVGGTIAGKHTISGCFLGFETAIRTDGGVTDDNCDETYFPEIFTHHCNCVFESDCPQSVSFKFGRVVMQVPWTRQATAFKFISGGKLSVEHLSIVGNNGVTILDVGTEQAENTSDFSFNNVLIDRALLYGTNPTDEGLYGAITFTAASDGGGTPKVIIDTSGSHANVRSINGWSHIRLSTSAADLPLGLSTLTDYWTVPTTTVAASTANYLATSLANAIAGTYVNWGDAGTGTHKLHYGYLRLIEQGGDDTLSVRMRGHISHGGSDLTAPYYNEGSEAIVNLANAEADVRLDIYGLDQQTALTYAPSRILTTAGSGAVYNLTNTAAYLNLGTTPPSVTLQGLGVWKISGWVRLRFNAATFGADETVTVKYRRTSGTPADLTGGSSSVKTGAIAVAVTQTWMDIKLPDVFHNATADNDTIQIWGHVTTVPGAGNLECTAAQITAQRVA